MVPPMVEGVHSPLPGWMIMSDTKVVKYVDSQHHAVPQGKYAVELVAGRETALVQEVPTTPGQWYALSFSVGDAAVGCQDHLVLEAYAARSRMQVPYEARGTGGHKHARLEFQAVAGVTCVVFQSNNYHMKHDGTLCGPVLDDVSLVSGRKRPARRLRL
jgi:hypothetical protein